MLSKKLGKKKKIDGVHKISLTNIPSAIRFEY